MLTSKGYRALAGFGGAVLISLGLTLGTLTIIAVLDAYDGLAHLASQQWNSILVFTFIRAAFSALITVSGLAIFMDALGIRYRG